MPTEINLIPKQTFDASAITTGIIGHARLPIWVKTKLADDQYVENSTVLVDDVDFQWTLVDGDGYQFTLSLCIDSAINAGFRFKFLAPGDNFIFGFCQDNIGVLAAGGTLQNEVDLTVVKVYATTSFAKTLIIVEGYLYAMSTGVYKLQWAQGTAQASLTKLEAGSIAIFHTLGLT